MRASFLIVCCMLAFVSTASSAQTKTAQPSKVEDNAPAAQEMLAVAKVTGACGILNSMVQFQKATKMDGGDEFVDRFWKTEAARRGMTVQQIIEECNAAVPIYDAMWKALDE